MRRCPGSSTPEIPRLRCDDRARPDRGSPESRFLGPECGPPGHPTTEKAPVGHGAVLGPPTAQGRKRAYRTTASRACAEPPRCDGDRDKGSVVERPRDARRAQLPQLPDRGHCAARRRRVERRGPDSAHLVRDEAPRRAGDLRKPTAKVAEERGLVYARRWVDRHAGIGKENGRVAHH